MATQRRTIGKVSKESGVKITTIRYYESIGLLPDPGRTIGGQRIYDKRTVELLLFIRHSRNLGFPIELRLKKLRALKRELAEMILSCGGGEVADCAILESIVSR